MGFPGFYQGVISFAEATGFDAFFDTTQRNTTSNGWVRYDTYTTDEEKDEGEYNISWSVEIGQSDKEKRVGFQAQWRTGTSGAWTTLREIKEAVSSDKTYRLLTGFFIVEHNADDFIQVRIRWGQTDDGGTGRIRNVGVILYKTGDLP
jgi:hypothetical protein